MTTPHSGGLARQWRFFLKELRETLRDRRTIMTLVLMPLLVYPLLGITFQKFFVVQFATQEAEEFILAFPSEPEAMAFRAAFSRGNQLLGRELNPGTPLPPKPGDAPVPELKFAYPEQGETIDLEQTLRRHQADVAIRQLPADAGGQTRFELLTLQGSVLGHKARDYLSERLTAVNDDFIRSFLRSQPEPVALPLEWEPRILEDKEATSEFSLATLVPLVLILMTVTGAVYPAIDLTAGERERGTLEALIASPVSRQRILVAKYMAVVVVALLTALVNVISMIATAYGTGLEQTLFGSGGLTLPLIVQILGLLAVFAGFFSAVMLAVTSVARSFKEAQAYLIPLMMLSLAPGIMGLMPGLEMSTGLALTPLVNMVVLTRDLLDGRVQPVWIVLAFGSSIGYAGIALAVAARIYGTDSVLYGSAGTWGELFQRPEQSRATPKLAHGLIAIGVLFPAYILLGSLPGRLSHWTLSSRLMVSGLLTILLFAVWPWAVCQALRIVPRTAFGLQRASGLSFLAAVIAGLSLWPFAYELEILTLNSDRIKQLVELFKGLEVELQQVPVFWKLTALAVIPAICEELFFRGFLFRAFRSAAPRSSAWGAIAGTAVLFGLFHVLVRDVLLLERFLPTALMGLALGWVAARTGSTLPGMVLHVLHNSTLLLLPLWGPRIGILAAADQRTHLPWAVLLLAGTGVIVAGGLLLANRHKPLLSIDGPQG